jgi:hypothetical protein
MNASGEDNQATPTPDPDEQGRSTSDNDVRKTDDNEVEANDPDVAGDDASTAPS